MTTEWAISLNGAIVTQGCTADEFCVEPVLLVEGLDDTPDGLGLPAVRNEDVTYYQRDGRKMFSDWYEGRTLTFVATVGPLADCPECSTARSVVLDLAQAWKRSMVNQELVIYPPCPVVHSAENAYPPTECAEGFGFGEGPFGDSPFGGSQGCTTVATNLAVNPSAETETGWVNQDPTLYDDSWDTTVFFEGTKSRRLERLNVSLDPSLAGIDNVGLTSDTPGAGTTATAGTTYTGSVYLYAGQAGYSGQLTLFFNNGGGGTISGTDTGLIVLAAETWTRFDVSMVAPVGTATAHLSIYAEKTDASNAVPGDFLNADAAMLTEGALVDYFDGSTEPVFSSDDDGWFVFSWTGDANESTSTKAIQAARFAGTIESGPYGVIGRPRRFEHKWLNRAEQIAQVVMRFDAVDQRMYILDECGTPGTSSCVNIEPGSELFTRCYVEGGGDYAGELVRCYTGAGRCYPTPLGTSESVEPAELNVGGTERVFPTITLYGDLQSPRIENVTTGEWVMYDGTISSLPVTINTEEGTAFDSEGTSKTHLLRGELHLSMDPGNYEWRLLSFGNTDDPDEAGYALTCWRDTVVVG